MLLSAMCNISDTLQQNYLFGAKALADSTHSPRRDQYSFSGGILLEVGFSHFSLTISAWEKTNVVELPKIFNRNLNRKQKKKKKNPHI